MQIGPHLSSARPVDAIGPGRAHAAGNAASPSRETLRTRDDNRSPSASAGLKTWSPRFNEQVGKAQIAADYLDRGIGQLKSVRSLLGQQITAGEGDVVLQRRIGQFAALWQSRPAQAAGSLDPALTFDAVNPPLRQFTVRGLELASLRDGDSESLSFSVAGAGRRTPSVALEPALPDVEIVRRFDQALASTGVRATADDQGRLVFSVAEQAWPGVRDTLMLRGGGIRWPTGQFSRVQAQALPDGIDPARWSVDDPDAMRATLVQATRALDAFTLARRRVDEVLLDAAQRADAVLPPNAAERAAGFADAFAALGESRSYRALNEFSGALAGIRRERVQALLAAR
jgi:hypothetical protein